MLDIYRQNLTSIVYSCLFEKTRKSIIYFQMHKQWFSPFSNFTQLPQSIGSSQNPMYYHSSTNSTLEKIMIKINERDYDNAFNAYQWRFSTDYPIVKVFHAHLERETRDCVYVNLLLEKIDCNLERMSNLSMIQALYMLKTSLTGLEKLIEKFGLFDLTSKMIGITRNKQCKIWCNENMVAFQRLRGCNDQQTAISRLFHLVQERTQLNYQSQTFFTKAQRQCSTFIRSQNLINQFSYEQDVIIPPIFLIREKERRNSVDTSLLNHLETKGYQVRSFVVDNCSGIPLVRNYSSRTERKADFLGTNKSFMKDSYTKTGSKTPTHISFTYQSNLRNINGSHLFKTPFPGAALGELKQSKQTMENSDNLNQRLLFDSQSQPFIPLAPHLSKESSISLGNQCSAPQFRKFQDIKKMSIISTLSLKIKSKSTLQELKTIGKMVESPVDRDKGHQMIKKLFQQNFHEDEWKKTVSQLFSSDRNLKESHSYGEEEKTYLKDLDLKHLNKFGRYISTSVLERDEDEEYESVPDIRGFLHLSPP